MKTIPYGKQFIDDADVRAISEAAKQDFITTGKSVKKFETNVSKFVQSKYTAVCNSGTSAIHLALIAVNAKKNDIIIMPAINFIAAYSMCNFIGAKVYLADVDNVSGQMTPENLIDCIKKNNLKNIKAVITMYLGGYPKNIDRFYKIKKKYKFYLIEDACHAFGAQYKYLNKFYKIGSCRHSDLATFSMHPLKTITTGEGGMVTTNNLFFYKKIIRFRSHGIDRDVKKHWKYNIKEYGFNYRLSDLNCALGLSQLKKVNKFINDRRRIYNIYKKELNKYKNYINLISIDQRTKPSFHLILIKINFKKLKKNKDDLLNYLKKKNFFCQQHYIPIFNFSAYDKQKKFSNSKEYYQSSLSLPIYYNLEKKIIEKIISLIVGYLKS